jgi:hypothetical protein
MSDPKTNSNGKDRSSYFRRPLAPGFDETRKFGAKPAKPTSRPVLSQVLTPPPSGNRSSGSG